MTKLASPEVIANRLVIVFLRYVGIAIAIATVSVVAFIFFTLRWLLASTPLAVVILLALGALPVVIVWAVQRRPPWRLILPVGLSLGLGLPASVIMLFVAPEFRLWTFDVWARVVNPPTFIANAALQPWEDREVRSGIIWRMEQNKPWPADDAVPALRLVLSHPNIENEREGDLARRALILLEKYEADAAPAVPELIDLVDHPKYGWMACDALAKIGPAAEAAQPRLLNAVRSRGDVAAARALCFIAPEDAGPEAATLLAIKLSEAQNWDDRYKAWLNCYKLPAGQYLVGAFAPVFDEWRNKALQSEGENEIGAALTAAHILWRGGGIQVDELLPILDKGLTVRYLRPVGRMHGTPVDVAIKLIEDMGSAGEAAAPALERLKESLQRENDASNAKYLDEVLAKVRKS